MVQRGRRPQRLIREKWDAKLAYAIGLIATDGCLARHSYLIDLTSKDREQLENFSRCLGIKLFIGVKYSGIGNRYFRVQFKNRYFYEFLLKIGLTPAKSKTIGPLQIPPKYFFDFLRGVFDGDGSSYSYWDPRWRSSFLHYLEFCSASPAFIKWLQKEIYVRLGISGHITTSSHGNYRQLKYAKNDSTLLFRQMYRLGRGGVVSLSRKRLKIEKALRIIAGQSYATSSDLTK